jgi:hypothetical protein
VVASAATTAPQTAAARRSQIMPVGHRAWFRALAGVCIFLASLALAACGSVTSTRPVSPGFAGYDWQVVAISHGGKVTTIPARMQVALQFSPGGQFGANDSVNFHSGTYHTASGGFTTSVLAVTLAGYGGHGGHDPPSCWRPPRSVPSTTAPARRLSLPGIGSWSASAPTR